MDLAELGARLEAGEALTAEDLDALGPTRDRFGHGAIGIRWGTFRLEQVTAHIDIDATTSRTGSCTVASGALPSSRWPASGRRCARR
jgi:hypothetical protein